MTKTKKTKTVFKGMGDIAAAIEAARSKHRSEETAMMASLNRLGQKADKIEAEAVKEEVVTAPVVEQEVAEKEEEKAIETALMSYDTFLSQLTAKTSARDYYAAVRLMRQVMTHPKFPHGLRTPAYPLFNSIAEYISLNDKYKTKTMTPFVKKTLEALALDINEKLSNYTTILLNRREEQRIINSQSATVVMFPPIVEEKTVLRNVPLLVSTTVAIEAPYPAGVERITGRVFIVSADMIGLPFFDPELVSATKKKKAAPKKKKIAAKQDAPKVIEKAYAAEHKKAVAFAAKKNAGVPLDQRIFCPESDGVWFACLPACFPHAAVDRVTFPDRTAATEGGISAHELEKAMRKRNIARQRKARLNFDELNKETLAEIKRLTLTMAEKRDLSKEKGETFKDLVGLPATTNIARLKAITAQHLKEHLAGERSLTECVRIRRDWQIQFNRVMEVKTEYMKVRAEIREIKHKIDALEAKIANAKEQVRTGVRAVENETESAYA